MAQKQLDEYKLEFCPNSGSQTFIINNNRRIKLYYSTVYKENILAFCLSSSKHFILTKKTWKIFKKLIPIIDLYLGHDD